MNCKRCGEPLRDGDLFCAKCGTPVTVGEIYYDEKLYKDDKKAYRDTFLDKGEDRSHALLITVALLLVIAVAAVAFGLGFFAMKNGQLFGGIFGEKDSSSGENVQMTTELDGDRVVIKIEPETASAEEETEIIRIIETEAQPQGAEAVQETENSVQTETETEEAVQTSIDTARIEQILQEESTTTQSGVYIYDLENLKEYGTSGSGDAMYASALISVPILYTAAVLLDTSDLTLDTPIVYVNSIGGRGEAYPEEKEGQEFPLSYYLTTMLTYSDNNCMNCLIDCLGLDTINQTCQNAGFSSVDLERKIVDSVTDGKENYVSPKDLAGMLKEMANGKFRTISRSFIEQYFKIDEGDAFPTLLGLASDLPADCLFLNQNGRGDTRYNEVALIGTDSCRYVVGVMCMGSLENGFSYETALEDVSNYIYNCLSASNN